MKRLFITFLNEEEPSVHISLLFGIPAWILLTLLFLGVLSHRVMYVILSLVLGVLGTITGIISLFKCKRKRLAWFVTCLSGSLVAFFFVFAVWANSELKDLH